MTANWYQLAPAAYEAEVDGGVLNVWSDPKGWNYSVSLGHMTLGTRLDPPDWVEDIDLIVPGCASKADAQFKAERHADRLLLMDAINGAFADEQQAAEYEEERLIVCEHGNSILIDGCAKCADVLYDEEAK